MASTRKQKTRSTRINLRATSTQQKLIRTGAQSRGVSVSQFILDSACLQAEQALADRREFVLPASQWQAFMKALDRPARNNPALARLFTTLEEADQDSTGER